MENVTITEVSGEDVKLRQQIDTDTVMASAGAVAVNGDVDDSAINTGRNSGIMAGEDVDLDDSIVGDDNTQLNDSWIGAFAGQGDATYADGENVNLGSGQLIDVDAKEDAQVITGNGNEVTGDVDVDLDRVEGPVNLAVGDENRQYGFDDESVTFEDSFNTDASVEDSFNTLTEYNETVSVEDNDQYTEKVSDSFNHEVEVNDTDLFSETETWIDESTYESNDLWATELEEQMQEVEVWGDDNEIHADQ